MNCSVVGTTHVELQMTSSSTLAGAINWSYRYDDHASLKCSERLYTQPNGISSHINKPEFPWPNTHTSSCFPFGQYDSAFVAPLYAPFSLADVALPVLSAAEARVSASSSFDPWRSYLSADVSSLPFPFFLSSIILLCHLYLR